VAAQLRPDHSVLQSESSAIYPPGLHLSNSSRHAGSEDTDFDKRLDALKKGKGATPYGKSRQDKAPQQSASAQPQGKKKQGKPSAFFVCHMMRRIFPLMHAEPLQYIWELKANESKSRSFTCNTCRPPNQLKYCQMSYIPDMLCSCAGAKYDFTGEQVHFESGPHKGDVAVNVALGATLLWLPLTAAAVGRGAFVKYRFTDKRISVITNAPWKKEQLDAAYQEVDDVVSVGRGLGLWGDMVVTLKNGDKIEMRSLPKYGKDRLQQVTVACMAWHVACILTPCLSQFCVLHVIGLVTCSMFTTLTRCLA
jgi:hypothetical protein